MKIFRVIRISRNVWTNQVSTTENWVGNINLDLSVHPLVQILNQLRRQKLMIAMGVTARLGKLTSTYSLST